jgi:tetratricopeptide (TPR) repeat protein
MIVRTSLEYLDALAADAADDASLQRDLAMAYEKVADVQGGFRSANLGNRAGAIASYGKALAIRTALADADPGNRELLRELVRNYGKLSDVSLDDGDPDAAVEYSERGMALAEKLALGAEATVADRRNLAAAWLNIGYQLALMQQAERGLPLMRRAVRLYEELAAGSQETAPARRYLALAHQRIGEILLGSPNPPAEALEAYRNSLAVTEGLLQADPRNTGLKKIQAYALLGLAAAHTREGAPRAALEAQQRAALLLRGLLDADPQNAEARFDTANALGEAVDALLTLHELDAAEREANESIGVLAASTSSAEEPHSHARILLALNQLRLATVSAMRAADASAGSGAGNQHCVTARSWLDRSAPILRAAEEDAIWHARLDGRVEYVKNLLGACGAAPSLANDPPSSAASAR